MTEEQKRIRRFREISSHLPDSGFLLDVGAMDGVLSFFTSMIYKGIDIEPKSDIVRKFDITCEKVDQLGRFDIIVLSEILEHISDFQTAISNCKLLLKNGGKLIITVPNVLRYWNVFSYLNSYDSLLNNIQMEHIHGFTEQLLFALLLTHGFKILYYDRIVPYNNKSFMPDNRVTRLFFSEYLIVIAQMEDER